MTNWIMSANPTIYDHRAAFSENGYIDWKQTRNFLVGDIVYIYCTKPIGQICYKTIVVEINKTQIDNDRYWLTSPPESNPSIKYMRLSYIAEIDDSRLSYTALKDHGMKYPPQSPCKVNDELLLIIEQCFGGANS